MIKTYERLALPDGAVVQMRTETALTAVCIGLDADDQLNELAGALAPFRCVHYRDVYRALARLSDDAPALILVDVAWLPTVAFEIFDILAQRQPELPVLVVGPVEAEARIRDALARGARDRATPDAIRTCMPARPAVAPTRPATPWTAAAASTGIQSDTFAPAGNVFDAELDRRLNEQLDDGVDDEEKEEHSKIAPAVNVAPLDEPELPAEEPHWDAVDAAAALDDEPDDAFGGEADLDDLGPRVPWLRYTDQPRRTPPHRTPPQRVPPAPRTAPAHGAVPAGAPILPPRTGLDAPLLTEAELAALLSPLRRGRQE